MSQNFEIGTLSPPSIIEWIEGWYIKWNWHSSVLCLPLLYVALFYMFTSTVWSTFLVQPVLPLPSSSPPSSALLLGYDNRISSAKERMWMSIWSVRLQCKNVHLEKTSLRRAKNYNLSSEVILGWHGGWGLRVGWHWEWGGRGGEAEWPPLCNRGEVGWTDTRSYTHNGG